MGHTSEEVTDLSKKAERTWPVKDVDYYILHVKRGGTTYPGWLYVSTSRVYITPAKIIMKLDQYKRGALSLQAGATDIFTSKWYLYPGARPNKKWGPVCP